MDGRLTNQVWIAGSFAKQTAKQSRKTRTKNYSREEFWQSQRRNDESAGDFKRGEAVEDRQGNECDTVLGKREL